MKVGDVFYFIKDYVANYGEHYYFNKGDKCQIVFFHSDTNYSITNITAGDGHFHFAHKGIRECLVTQDKWRELKLNEIL